MELLNKVVTVALLSPSDLATERDEVTKTIEKLSNKTTSHYGLTFVVKKWEDVAPLQKMRPAQYDIDDYICDADINIGMFYTKVGTKYDDKVAATVHEVNSAVLRYKRLKHTKDAPSILLYFKNDLRPIKDLYKKEEIQNAIEVRELRESYEHNGIVDRFDDVNELCNKVRDFLWKYFLRVCKISIGAKEAYNPLLSDLIFENILTFLEMDRGYSEKIIKLFDEFYYSSETPESYYTNFVFNLRKIKTKSRVILYERFLYVFVAYIRDQLFIHFGKIANRQKAVEVTNENMADFAQILVMKLISDATMSFDAVYSRAEEKLSEDVANNIKMQRIVYGENNSETSTNGADKRNESLQSNLLENVNTDVFILVTTIVTQSILIRINNFVEEVFNSKKKDTKNETDNPDWLPNVFLFSVVECPGKDELYRNIHYYDDNKSKSNASYESPLGFLHRILNEHKFHYRALFERSLLDDEDVVKEIYAKEE